MPGESRLRENCTGGSEGRAEAADLRVCRLPRPDSDEGLVMRLERRGRADQGQPKANPAGEEPRDRPKPKVKSFEIDKRLVFEAWKKVRSNKGAPGVDAVSVATVRNSSGGTTSTRCGTGCPQGATSLARCERVEIPKDHGAGVRLLGVPNTVDRVAADCGSDAAGGEAGADLPSRQLRLPSRARLPTTRWP